MRILNKLFRKIYPIKARKDAKVFKTGGSWGDAIKWMNIASRRVVGWKTSKPRVGDKLESPMESGKIGVFIFTAIEHCGDPQDMFFGNVKDFGYKES